MCLLKPGQLNCLCGHNECNSFYMLNRGPCAYNMTQAKPQELLIQNPKGIPMNCLVTQMNSAKPSLGSQNDSQLISLNQKRVFVSGSDPSTDEENEVSSVQKKMKTEIPMNSLAEINAHLNSLNYGAKNLNNINSTLNHPMMLQKTAPDMMTYIQNSQKMASNMSTPLYMQAQSNRNHLLTQNLVQANVDQNNLYINNNNIGPSSQLKEMMSEFENRIFGFVQGQNKLLQDLNQKNDLIQDTLACLISEISSLKNVIENQGPVANDKPAKVMNLKSSEVSNSNESISSDDLLTHLYGSKTDFEYQIVLNKELSLPLYRERNFDLSVQLVDKEGNPVINSNKIPLTINIYTCQSPPTLIDINTAGNKIFKGFTEKDLSRGSVNFEKIQVKEVTSHFRNGWVYLVVQPKNINGNNPTLFLEKEGINVDIQKIKPLIIENVVVKAKKIKEKEDKNQSQE